jgi:hypothetical protein
MGVHRERVLLKRCSPDSARLSMRANRLLKTVRSLLTITLSAGALTTTMHAADDFTGSAPTVFVMTNDNLKNEVLEYQRPYNGSFTLRGSFATGGRGSGGTTDPFRRLRAPLRNQQALP